LKRITIPLYILNVVRSKWWFVIVFEACSDIVWMKW